MMAMTMMAVIVMMIIVCMIVVVAMMIMSVRTLRVGAAFRIEGRLDRCQARAQPFQHRLEHSVRPHAQPIGENLHRHVTITEMPGETRQMCEIAAANFDERLGLDHDIDETAVVEFERIAVAQQNGLGKHRADLRAIYPGEASGL